MDTSQFGGSFWITIAGLGLSFLGAVSMYCSCWGLIKVERDVSDENDEEKMELDHGISPFQQPQLQAQEQQ